MSLAKEITKAYETGVIQVVKKFDDRDEEAYCLEPGVDVSGESQEVQDLAATTWTQEVIDARKAQLEAAI